MLSFIGLRAAGNVLLTTSPTFGYTGPCASDAGHWRRGDPVPGQRFQLPPGAIATSLFQVGPAPRLLLSLANSKQPHRHRLAPELSWSWLLPHRPTRSVWVVDELYEAFTGDSVLPRPPTSAPHPTCFGCCAPWQTAGFGAGLRIGLRIGSEGGWWIASAVSPALTDIIRLCGHGLPGGFGGSGRSPMPTWPRCLRFPVVGAGAAAGRGR